MNEEKKTYSGWLYEKIGNEKYFGCDPIHKKSVRPATFASRRR
jgi:hypothetical protein